MNIKIGESDFERMFQLEKSGIPDMARDRFKEYDLTCHTPTAEDLDEYVLTYLGLEEENAPARQREENLAAFEEGWQENLEQLRTCSPEGYETALKPKYFRGSKFLRYNNTIVVTENLQLEYELFVIARLCLFDRYLKHAETIVELGSGTCSNLLLLSTMFPDVRLVGLDWTLSSSNIADELGRRFSRPIIGRVFDMFAPDPLLEINEGSAIISIHAFEQLGREFKAVLDFVISARPSVVMQYEPILEFYEDTSLDRYAIGYCRRRGYLEGYYGRLREMEREGSITILAAYRPYLGGVLHEHSVLVWNPV